MAPSVDAKKVAVVGAGTMGSGIAQVFAAHGFAVLLADVREEFVARGLDAVRRSLARFVTKGEITESGAADVLARIAPTTRIEDARDATLALADLIGLDVCLGILEVLQRDLGDPKYRPCPLLRRMVAAGRLGVKAGRGFYEYKKEG